MSLRTAVLIPLLTLLTSGAAVAGDYPTLDRVSYALICMKKHGGQTIQNLYACSCAIDQIAGKMSTEDYNEALTYQRYKRMPGEKGGIFRDSERGKMLIERLKAAEAEAEKHCFLGGAKVVAPPSKKGS